MVAYTRSIQYPSSMEEKGVHELPSLTLFLYIFGGVSFLYENGPRLASHMAVNGPIPMSIWIAQIVLHVLLKNHEDIMLGGTRDMVRVHLNELCSGLGDDILYEILKELIKYIYSILQF